MWSWSLDNKKVLANYELLCHGEQWEVKDYETNNLSFLNLLGIINTIIIIIIIIIKNNKCHFQLSLYFTKTLEIEGTIN
jgi:hypothetical protein